MVDDSSVLLTKANVSMNSIIKGRMNIIPKRMYDSTRISDAEMQAKLSPYLSGNNGRIIALLLAILVS